MSALFMDEKQDSRLKAREIVKTFDELTGRAFGKYELRKNAVLIEGDSMLSRYDILSISFEKQAVIQ